MDAPSFVLDETASAAAPTAPIDGEGDDMMVLVPTTTFPTPGTLAPNAPPDDDDDDDDDDKGGKGKGPGGKGGGGSSEGETGAPAPATPTTTVPAFWLDVHEVSARAYAACVAAGRCTDAGVARDCTVVSDRGRGDHPANCVSIDQARAFCAWRGKRLVKNDEWTAASAGAEQRPYPWGADAPTATRLNACSADDCGGRSMFREADGWATTAPVGSFAAGRSPEGVSDLAGNVAEWVDLTGTLLVRGGSYADDAIAGVSSLAVRAVSGPDPTIGFRCAKDADGSVP